MGDTVEIQKGIFEFINPQTINTDEWARTHLDCDAIIDNLGSDIVVYAYTRDPQYNYILSDYRRKKYTTKKILKGISSNGLNSLF